MLAVFVAAVAMHGSVSAGAGTAFDYAGVRLEIRLDHDSNPGPFKRDVFVIPDAALGAGFEF